ncbi:MAG: beta-ketoacyl synthase chain length factor [Nitrospirota bacterium]|nr:MAG: beta-ketoacyl synthase chain length factor [Nitrospirota bacterium]
MQVNLNGIGLLGPGLCGWPESQQILLGKNIYDKEMLPKPFPSILQPNELRRSSEVVRWSLRAAEEAMRQAQLKPDALATVFASSGGETEILHKICLALNTSERAISPTLFHHSVHNASAGYWSIGVQSQLPSSSLSCYDSSFCGGLIEAATFVCSHQTPVLLVAYDIPPPPPLYAARPLSGPFAVAFVMSPAPLPQSFSILKIGILDEGAGTVSTMKDPGLEMLRDGNPAARALPVLTAIASGGPAALFLNYLDNLLLSVDVMPCQPCPN